MILPVPSISIPSATPIPSTLSVNSLHPFTSDTCLSLHTSTVVRYLPTFVLLIEMELNQSSEKQTVISCFVKQMTKVLKFCVIGTREQVRGLFLGWVCVSGTQSQPKLNSVELRCFSFLLTNGHLFPLSSGLNCNDISCSSKC